MAKLVLPRVQAMVLCDAIEESSQESGAFDLNGVRSMIEAPSFPYTRPRMCVYLQMSGHVGEALCRIEINRAETDDVVFRTAPRAISFEGPMFVVPVRFRLRNCGFPAPGVYYVQIFCASKLIGERPLHLIEGGD
jgi:hypothetical protein